MQVQFLQHKHGGRIVELYGVHHEAPAAGKRGYWELSGHVQWADGSESPSAHIEPLAMCYDHDNPQACAEFDAVLEAINSHLREHGSFNADGEWIAKRRRGSTSLGSRRELIGIPA